MLISQHVKKIDYKPSIESLFSIFVPIAEGWIIDEICITIRSII
jgi:hypothetical protein